MLSPFHVSPEPRCASPLPLSCSPPPRRWRKSVPVPAAITAEGVPAIPAALADAVRPYLEYRTAAFQGWNPATRGMLITTRFGNAAQLHSVAAPGAARTQLTFEADPIAGGSYGPDGAPLVALKDVGGGEFFQLYTRRRWPADPAVGRQEPQHRRGLVTRWQAGRLFLHPPQRHRQRPVAGQPRRSEERPHAGTAGRRRLELQPIFRPRATRRWSSAASRCSAPTCSRSISPPAC